MNRPRLLWLVPLLLLIAACGGPDVEPAAVEVDQSPRSAEVEIPTVVPTEDVAVAVVPESPTAVPTATAELEPTATNEPTEPTAEPTPEEEVEDEEVAAEPTAMEVVFDGRTEEGALFRGAADAPVTLIDYSDFL